MDYLEANKKGRERLRILASRLTDEQLALPAGDGWTVAAILAHLAFWDYRMLVLVKRWKQTEVGLSPIDPDAVNDAMIPLCLAIPVRAAADLAIRAAEAVDAELEKSARASESRDGDTGAGREAPAGPVDPPEWAYRPDRKGTGGISEKRKW